MSSSDTRDTNVSASLNDLEKGKLEKLADVVHESSQSGVIRHWIDENYHDHFGDIHPDALERSDVDEEALADGTTRPDEIDDDLKISGDGPAQVPASDGGIATRQHPESYTPTYTPDELAESGPELTWDELQDAINRHFDDGLTIHPDRVRRSSDVEVGADGSYSDDEYAVLASQRPVAQVLAGILRHHGDVVDEKLVDAMIRQYTEHQIKRADTEAGREYKIRTYKQLLVDEFEYLVPHPDPTESKYFTSQSVVKHKLGRELREVFQNLESATRVLDPKRHAQKAQTNPKEDPSEWLSTVGEFRVNLGILHNIREREELRNALLEWDHEVFFDDVPNMMVMVTQRFQSMLREYQDINQYARFIVAETVLDLEENDLLDIEDPETGDVINPDRPATVVREFVTSRETPLSPQSQIKTVAEKI